MPTHSLLRLTASLYNKPHLIEKNTFQSIASYLDARNAGLSSLDVLDRTEEKEPLAVTDNKKIGVINIEGPLTYKPTMFEAICGMGCSYQNIIEQAQEMVSSGVETIVMNIDSGGGEAYGAFEAANDLRALADQNLIKLVAYVDGSACSAAYALACVADEVISNPYADVGSIGVLVALANDSEALKKEGIERIFITDGFDKVPFDAEGKFREGFLKDIQRKVTELGDAFRSHVEMHTGVSSAELKATEARVYTAKDALALGLINKIQTKKEFISYITQNK